MKIGVLISGRGSNLQSLINAQLGGQLSAEIAAVISNVPEAGGLERASKVGIASTVVNHRQFDKRDDFDEALTWSFESYYEVTPICTFV